MYSVDFIVRDLVLWWVQNMQGAEKEKNVVFYNDNYSSFYIEKGERIKKNDNRSELTVNLFGAKHTRRRKKKKSLAI